MKTKRKKLKAKDASQLRLIDAEIARLAADLDEAERAIHLLKGQLAEEANPATAATIQAGIRERSDSCDWLRSRIATLESQRFLAAAADAKTIVHERLRASNADAAQSRDAAADFASVLNGVERSFEILLHVVRSAHASRTTAIGLISKHNLPPPPDAVLHPIAGVDPDWEQRLQALARKIGETCRFPGTASSWIAQLNECRARHRNGVKR